MRKQKLYSVDPQGNLNFHLRHQLLKYDSKTESIWEHPIASIFIVVLCAVLDFIMFRQIFSRVLYDDIWTQALGVVSLLISFEIAPLYLGILKKRMDCRLNAGKFIAVLLLCAFVVGVICNAALRFATKDLVLPDFSSASISTIGETQVSEGDGYLPLLFAIFGTLLPIITSFVSFSVSYMSYHPLKQKLKKLRQQQLALEDNINKHEAAEVEYQKYLEYMEKKLAEDEEYYLLTKQLIEKRALLYANYVRHRIKEKLLNPTANNVLSDNTISILKKIDQLDDEFLKMEEKRKGVIDAEEPIEVEIAV